MAYKYNLTYLTRTKSIDPKSIGKIVVAQEENEIFFREKMNGSLEVSGEDYEFLIEAKFYTVQCCQEITLRVERQCGSGESELFWQGYFTLYDIGWDYDNKTATIKKINTRDDYSPIFANWEKEVNWLEGAVKFQQGYVIPNRQPLTPFKYSFRKTEEYNPRGSSNQDFARHFNTAIQWLIKRTLSGTEYEYYGDVPPAKFSQFLNADTNPVTGNLNYLKQVSILHLSDAKRPGATNPATVGTVTLKSVLEDLKKMYNAYWFLDEEGFIRIEHFSFFPNRSYTAPAITLDLTADKFKEVMKGNNRLGYEVDKLKGIEGFSFSITESARDAHSDLWESHLSPATEEFDAAYMIYSESCVPKNDKGEKSTEFGTVTNFVTNWVAVVNRPDTLPNEGFVLVHTIVDNSADHVPHSRLPISRVMTESGCMSATALYLNFGRYNNSFAYGIFSAQKERPVIVSSSSTAQITERPLRSRTTKMIETLPEIELSLCCGDEYNWTGLIKHPLADNCMVQQLEYDLILQTVTATITAPNTCTDNPYPDYEENEGPQVGCPVSGSLIRTQTATTSIPGNTSYYTQIITYTSVYADGSCGEYSSTREEKKSIPKRGNGPR